MVVVLYNFLRFNSRLSTKEGLVNYNNADQVTIVQCKCESDRICPHSRPKSKRANSAPDVE